MEDFEEIVKAFGELDTSKMSLSDIVRCAKLMNELSEFMKEMIVKYSFDTPSKSTFLFKMGDD